MAPQPNVMVASVLGKPQLERKKRASISIWHVQVAKKWKYKVLLDFQVSVVIVVMASIPLWLLLLWVAAWRLKSAVAPKPTPPIAKRISPPSNRTTTTVDRDFERFTTVHVDNSIGEQVWLAASYDRKGPTPPPPPAAIVVLLFILGQSMLLVLLVLGCDSIRTNEHDVTATIEHRKPIQLHTNTQCIHNFVVVVVLKLVPFQ